MDILIALLIEILIPALGITPTRPDQKVSLWDGIKVFVTLFTAVLPTLLLWKLAMIIGSLIYVQLDFVLAILLTLGGALFSYILNFWLIFRGISFIEEDVRALAKKRKKRLQFARAKELILTQHYSEALHILERINDPIARKWEAKLREFMPHDPDFLKQLKQH